MGTEALSATTSTSSTISVDPTSKSELARSERIAEKYIGKFCDLRARIEKYDLSPHGKNEDFMISRDFSKVLEEALGLQIVPSSKRRILVSALDALLLLPQHERGSYLPSRTPQEILCASMLELGMYKQALKLAKGMSSDYSDDKSCVLSGISDALVIANMGRAKKYEYFKEVFIITHSLNFSYEMLYYDTDHVDVSGRLSPILKTKKRNMWDDQEFIKSRMLRAGFSEKECERALNREPLTGKQ